MDGVSLHAELRREFPGLADRIVFLSGDLTHLTSSGDGPIATPTGSCSSRWPWRTWRSASCRCCATRPRPAEPPPSRASASRRPGFSPAQFLPEQRRHPRRRLRAVIRGLVVQVDPAHQHVLDFGGEFPAGVMDDFRLDGGWSGWSRASSARSARAEVADRRRLGAVVRKRWSAVSADSPSPNSSVACRSGARSAASPPGNGSVSVEAALGPPPAVATGQLAGHRVDQFRRHRAVGGQLAAGDREHASGPAPDEVLAAERGGGARVVGAQQRPDAGPGGDDVGLREVGLGEAGVGRAEEVEDVRLVGRGRLRGIAVRRCRWCRCRRSRPRAGRTSPGRRSGWSA